ncbi:MAG: DUF3786 domain-containing protein [Lachnospiraceae bacterium]|nr:DUF3786 domain-containing protein [Lachnospiraceae bacterium]
MANRQYEEMLSAAKLKLKDRTPENLAEKGNLFYDREKQEFCFELFGTKTMVSYPDYVITPEPNMWLALTVLQYLDEADGTPLQEGRMSLSEFKEGGLIRGASFDRENDKIIRQVTAGKSPEEIKQAILNNGGELMEGKADLCAKFSFLPNFPLYLNLWFADEEFPASCKVLFNPSAEHYLKVEAAGTIAGILLSETFMH